MKLELEKEVIIYMHDHGEETYPNECCGFFYGKDGEIRTITHVQKAGNAKEGDQRRRFRIDPREYQKAEKYASDHGLDLLGIYHTHPDHPAEPSEHDRKVALPFFSYIIISVREGKVSDTRSWRLNDRRQFDEEPLEVQQPFSPLEKGAGGD